MTEFEKAALALHELEAIQTQVQIVQAQAALVGDSGTTYITLLFGYLVVAYFLGQELKKRDLMILNGLYIAFIFGAIESMKTSYSAGIMHLERLLELDSSHGGEVFWTLEMMTFFLAFMLISACASLYFMWSVRHPKTE